MLNVSKFDFHETRRQRANSANTPQRFVAPSGMFLQEVEAITYPPLLARCWRGANSANTCQHSCCRNRKETEACSPSARSGGGLLAGFGGGRSVVRWSCFGGSVMLTHRPEFVGDVSPGGCSTCNGLYPHVLEKASFDEYNYAVFVRGLGWARFTHASICGQWVRLQGARLVGSDAELPRGVEVPLASIAALADDPFFPDPPRKK